MMTKTRNESFRRYSILTLGFILLIVMPICSQAANINVPAQYATIQAAIEAAANNDIITVQPGTYTENITFKGKAIILTATNPLDPAIVASTIIDGNMNGSVVTFNTGETQKSVLTGFTIRNGNGTLNISDTKRYGGGIYCAGQANPTIRHNKIINNSADIGGAIYIHGNTAPIITTGPNASYPYAGVNQMVTLSVTATDADSDTLVYKWVAREGETITGSGPSVSFSSSTTGVKHIDLTIDDQHGGTAKATITVTIIGITLQTAPQMVVGQPATLSAILTPTVAHTPEYPVSITWSLTQGPATGNFDAAVNGTPQASSIVFTPTASGSGRIQAEYKVGTASVANSAMMTFNPVAAAVDPTTGTQETTIQATITGNNLSRVNGISIGAGITATIGTGKTETTLPVQFVISKEATPGSRTITLTTPDGSFTTILSFQIIALPSITANPANLNILTGSTGSITFSLPTPAPTGGATLALSSSAAGITTVPASASIPQGQQSVDVTITAVASGTASITANTAGYSKGQATVNVTNTPVITFSPSSLNVTKDLTQTATVSISNPAPTGGLVVALSETAGMVQITPSTVTIAAGSKTSPIFTVRGVTTGQTTIKATATGYPEASLPVTILQPITATPSTLNLTTGATGNVTLSIPTPAPTGGISITITSSLPSIATVPSTLTIPEGQQSIVVTVTAVAYGTATVTASTATSGYSNATATVNVTNPALITFSPSSLNVTKDLTQTATVSISNPAPTGGLVVALSETAGMVQITPSTVTIAAGSKTSPIFTVRGVTTGQTTIKATATGYPEASLPVNVLQPIAVSPGALSITIGGDTGVITYSILAPAPAGGVVLTLASTPTDLTTPSSPVIIPEGQTSANATITAVKAGLATISATTATAGYANPPSVNVTVINPAIPNGCGQVVAGTISVATRQNSYSLSLSANDTVTIRTSRTSGSVFPYLELYDPNGTLIAGGTGNAYANGCQIDRKVTVDGTYTVKVRDVNNTNIGDYLLYWERLNSPCSATALTCGQSVNGSFGATTSTPRWKSYTFTMATSEPVRIVINATSGSANPYVDLYKADGTLVGTNYGTWNTSSLTAGTYTVVVRDYYNGVFGAGNYTLEWQSLVTPCSGTTVTPTTCGTPASGTIATLDAIDVYSLSLSANDTVTIRTSRTSGSVFPYLELYDPNGTLIAGGTGNAYANGCQIDRKVTVDGTYTVKVRDVNNTNIGDYLLYWERLNSPCSATALTCGQSVNGSFGATTSTPRWKSYTFTMATSEPVRIVINATSGSANPYVDLYKADGTLVGTNYGTWNTSSLTAGTYTVVVRDYYNGVFGAGNYTLEWQSLVTPCSGTTVTPTTCGTPASGTIATLDAIDVYSLSLSANDTVTIRTSRTSGSVFPYLELYDPNGTLIAGGTGNAYANGCQIDRKVTVDGTYTVKVRDVNNTNIGDYLLYWERLNSPCSATALTCGQSVNGSFGATTSTPRWKSYTFTMATSEPVRIVINATSGSANPYVDLYKADGTLVGTNYGTWNTSSLTAGTYTVVVRDYYNGVFGAGNYTVSWQTINSQCP